MNKTVTITAGHSNIDSGAISRFSGDKEADIAVDMRNMLALYLEREGVTVDTDGEGKENQSLNQAVKLICGGKLAIEIHCNSSSHSKAGGVEALANPRHLYVCQQLCKSISESMGIPLRGQDNGWKAEDSGQHSKLAYVSKGGIILEMFFISNPDELKIWKAKKWVVAKNLAAVILKLI